MVLLFAPKINHRIQYIVKFVLKEICGLEYLVTSSAEEFLNFRGAKINYSFREFDCEALRICPSDFLFQKGIKDFSPEIREGNPYPVLFPQNHTQVKCHLNYDIFAAAFYLISRYEEYLPYLEDRYGRFEADQSVAYQKGFLEVPLVDIQAMELKRKLMEMFPFLTPHKRSFTFIPTYDIDVAYAYKGKGITRTVLTILKDMLTLDLQSLKLRWQVLTGAEPDPLDTYGFQLELQRRYRLNPIYFFLSGEFGPRDRNINIHSRSFQSLVKTLGDYAQTGIHPSFASNHKPARLRQEIKHLAETLNKPVDNSRQHYLVLRLPETYQNLIKNRIKKDYSMGYASHTGFRAGTCTPFNFYNLTYETETHLKVFPVTVMDGTLKDYMKLTSEEAIKKCQSLIDITKSVGGTFISLWHNDTLSEQGAWKGWREVYTEMIKYAQKKH